MLGPLGKHLLPLLSVKRPRIFFLVCLTQESVLPRLSRAGIKPTWAHFPSAETHAASGVLYPECDRGVNTRAPKGAEKGSSELGSSGTAVSKVTSYEMILKMVSVA